MTNKIVITGGPGTGKTSLIRALKNSGFTCFNEISREITLEYRKKGIDQLFLSDPELFSEELLKGRIKQYNDSKKIQSGCVFLDRGIPDIIAYLNFKKTDVSNKFLESVEKYRYDMILLLEPWEDIYSSDQIRYESFDEVVSIHGFIMNTYKESGYNPIIIPKISIENRLNFVIDKLNQYPNE
tara:strand:+ start:60 stop:608 length:549 start_codon:yes stop_codon:yes gene_type:complete